MPTLPDLPPWDQLQYYALPSESVVAVTGLNQVAIAGDPQRRTLIFSLIPPVTGSVLVSTSASAGGASGIYLNSLPPLVLDYADFGPLVNVPWYVSVVAPGNANLCVISHALLRWPNAARPLSPLELIDREPFQPVAGRANGNGNNGGFSGDRGAELAKGEADYLAAALERCQRGSGYGRNGDHWIPPSRWRTPTNPRP